MDGAALAVQHAPPRVLALLREHQQLLTKIKQKRAERGRLAERIEAAMAGGQRDGVPLFNELVALDRLLSLRKRTGCLGYRSSA